MMRGTFLNNIDNLHIRNLILGDKDRVKVENKTRMLFNFEIETGPLRMYNNLE